jgi:hypothetical protein
MDAMNFPSPDDLGRAPAWRNYVVAQAVQATLGLIPSDALAVGVELNGPSATLHVQLARASATTTEDLQEIVGELEALLGDRVSVGLVQTVVEHRQVAPSDGIAWIYLARVDDSTDEA